MGEGVFDSRLGQPKHELLGRAGLEEDGQADEANLAPALEELPPVAAQHVRHDDGREPRATELRLGLGQRELRLGHLRADGHLPLAERAACPAAARSTSELRRFPSTTAKAAVGGGALLIF